MGVVDFLVLGFCVWQIVEIWHHGDLFANWRDKVSHWEQGFFGWLSRLLSCPWCLSVWCGIIVSAIWYTEQPICRIILIGFAVSRFANIANDLTHPYNLTPNSSGGFKKRYLDQEENGTTTDIQPTSPEGSDLHSQGSDVSASGDSRCFDDPRVSAFAIKPGS